MANRGHYGAKRNMYLQQNGKGYWGGHTKHYEGIEPVSSPDGENAILVKTKGHKGFIKTRETWISGAEIGCSVAMNLK
jgi:hypothetical protein